jgi:hypothetical protein
LLATGTKKLLTSSKNPFVTPLKFHVSVTGLFSPVYIVP